VVGAVDFFVLLFCIRMYPYAGIGNRGGISRERFFFYCFGASALWYFLLGYLFTALSTFSWRSFIECASN